MAQLPVTKNQEIELEITALGSEGQGIGRYERYALFVEGALPGERVQVRVIKTTASYGVGKLLRILTPSSDRRVPRCAVFGRCGGCTLQHMSYEAQLRAKEEEVQSALERIGGFHGVKVLPVLGMEDPWQYRNKAAFPAGVVDGRPELGFFAPRSHRIVPLEDCPVQHPEGMAALRAVRQWAAESAVPFYDEKTHRGVLRHVVVRSPRGQAMVVLVTTGPLPKQARLVDLLQKEVHGLRSVVHNVNSDRTNVIFGSKFRTVWGEDRITASLMGMEFSVSAASFLQVNTLQTEVLYQTALDFAALQGTETVADLYCGTGTISLVLAAKAGEVVGIEIVPEAIEDARQNALKNGVRNARFVCAAAEQELPRMVEEGLRPEVVVLDPPRRGCEEVLLTAVAKAFPDRIVYVSCNPATLARDAKYLAEAGYQLVKAQPVDMFPWTSHVETVVLLIHQKSTEYFKVDYAPEDGSYMDKLPASATYSEIKQWISDNYDGMKVSSLYIAQVKQKYGIIERECYNKPKSQDAKQPQCPPEKAAAIEAALRHFKMI